MPTRWMSEKDAYGFLAKQSEGRLATCDESLTLLRSISYIVMEKSIFTAN
jgi:hypothetical protein